MSVQEQIGIRRIKCAMPYKKTVKKSSFFRNQAFVKWSYFLTVPIQSGSHPLASQGVGDLPQAETIIDPARATGGVFYVQDERYAAGAGMRRR